MASPARTGPLFLKNDRAMVGRSLWDCALTWLSIARIALGDGPCKFFPTRFASRCGPADLGAHERNDRAPGAVLGGAADGLHPHRINRPRRQVRDDNVLRIGKDGLIEMAMTAGIDLTKFIRQN